MVSAGTVIATRFSIELFISDLILYINGKLKKFLKSVKSSRKRVKKTFQN